MGKNLSIRRGNRFIDLTGQKFGRLVVMEESGRRCGRVLWRCICDCGQEKIVAGSDLTSGHTKSCGCLQREGATERRTTHGLHGHPLHMTWQCMIQRCTNHNHPAWKNYGGRGILICERWLANFENFLSDMGDRPAGLSIDRIDNDGNYEPGNCRWATKSQQNANRQTTAVCGMKGVVWREGLGWKAQITRNGIYNRLGYFATPELAHAAYLEAAAKWENAQ